VFCSEITGMLLSRVCRTDHSILNPNAGLVFDMNCMEQSTTISSNCFLPHSIQTPAEDISIRP